MRNANKEDSLNGNGWGQRYPVIAGLIRFHDFDLFGTQECKYHQLVDLKDSLPGYSYIGIGRDDGKLAGEFSAIFYKDKMFSLLKQGNFWLSAITDRPNKGWDAVLPRICTWGKFRNKKTGFTFFFFNLHMDHIGVKARAESAKLALAKIKELAGNTPTIFTGDFNVDQTSEPYRLLNNSGVLKDAYDLARFRYALNGTFNGFKSDRKTISRIDHIFLSKQFRVSRYGILTDSYRSAVTDSTAVSYASPSRGGRGSLYTAREPSDHFPVMAEIEY
jgi:endonuclease/exonuclease/phosphatase family metal-dependent hydrolase